MSFEIGDRAGDYEIIGILGAGGMGKVYKVRNVISERLEAMKVLLPNLTGDPEGADRFLREIKVQASLGHPNIAALHTALRIDNQLLMVMEYVEGTTIESLMNHGSMGMANAVDYTMQVLSALQYAHDHGVVHRDIKPANMMLTPAGQIKLMDFGIARAAQDRRLTQTGRTVGSLFYMSPEQINGANTDGRSDLYSLGVALYEMVTGRRPFDGDSDFSIMAAHLQQAPVPPIHLDPSVPMALNEVILMAIAKDVNARFQTADAFKAALNNTRQLMGLPSAYADATMMAQTVQSASAFGAPQQSYQPQPQYNQPQAQQPPPAYQPYIPPPPVAKSKSSRGLYMAVGSLVTIAVLALAVIKGPEMMRTFAGTKPKVQDPPPMVLAGNSQKPADPVSNPPARTPEPSSTPAATSKPAADPPRPVEPEPEPPAAPQRDRTTKVARAVRQEPVEQYRPAVQPPQQQQQQQQQPAIQPPNVQRQQPPAPEPNRAALNQVRELHNDLAIRAETCRGGLQSLKQQMANQGLGLRADIREAETRMNYQLREATAAIRAGDIDGAKRNLDMASHAIEVIERFLGR